MKTTINGFPINRNGKVLKLLPNDVVRGEFLGNVIKQNGTYLFFSRKQGNKFIYTE